MAEGELPTQIELLVDNLRKQDTTALSLTDVASVTEVLIGTMNVFFKSIDTSIYRECRALSDYITDARKEIAALQPGDNGEDRIPRAGQELDAIVQQTEEATDTIMTAAEEIMGADTEDMAAYQAITQDAVMRIFEACSFQDITGQRISKVVATLSHIEQRVLELRDLLGVTDQDIETAHSQEDEKTEEERLLSGPALKGEGIGQSEIDKLMGEATPAEAPAPKAETAPQAEPEPAEATAPEAKAEPKAKPEPVAKVAPKAKAPAAPVAPPPPKPVNPKILDSMFAEDFDPVADLAAKTAAEAKAEEAKPEAKPEKKEEKAAASDTASLPDKEEVSQDDIDALFS
ncbi:MAG: protein phosphatase CheZ [Kordiimonadaceae bacterium]|nr:protein phosphatase CheZ [Kordiimonadaceae bacterium]